MSVLSSGMVREDIPPRTLFKEELYVRLQGVHGKPLGVTSSGQPLMQRDSLLKAMIAGEIGLMWGKHEGQFYSRVSFGLTEVFLVLLCNLSNFASFPFPSLMLRFLKISFSLTHCPPPRNRLFWRTVLFLTGDDNPLNM